jgi:uncharacterized protein
LSYFPAVGIVGPRQVGKTTLAKIIQQKIAKPCLYLDLELDSDVLKLTNAEAYLQSHADKCVIIDEIQLMPRLFTLIRALIDQQREPARFLILGSASPNIIRQSSESLAGRIAYHELSPLSYSEVNSANISMNEHWFKGGFPDALLAPKLSITQKWLRNFTHTFMEKNLKLLGYDISIQTMSKLYSMMAHLHGQILNVNTLSQSLGVSNPTVAKYLNLLEGGFLLSRLQPYYVNVGKRLVKSPKMYFRDSGILHQLSNIADFEALQGNPLVGASWEGYVIEEIKRNLGNSWQYYYYRTQAGAETDLVLISPNNKMTCIEIKHSSTPKISKGFYQTVKDLKPDNQYIIIPNGESFYLNDTLKVINLADFLKMQMTFKK